MFDRVATQFIAPAVDALATRLHRRGIGANTITFAGFGLGLLAAMAIALGAPILGLALIWLSRSLDALDGAVARLTQPTDQGGFLDITLDFLFYASIPLAFAIADREANALAASVLLAAFIGTGSSFLAFAIIAAKRQMKPADAEQPKKSFYFLGGLIEAFETLLFFSAMCIWPRHFAVLASVFAALCVVTIVTRVVWGYKRFADDL